LNKTAHVLKHEQGHFDIAEIFARKLFRQMTEYRYNNRTYKEDLTAIYDNIVAEKAKMQGDYDRETNHSLNRYKQNEWLKKIEALLEDNKPWAQY
jgi:predicted secreted Zn-dependent protease